MIYRLYVFEGLNKLWVWVLVTFMKIAKLYIISSFSLIIGNNEEYYVY